MVTKALSIEEILGIEKIEPRPLQRGLKFRLETGQEFVADAFSGIRSRYGTLYLVNVTGRFMGTKATVRPRLRRRHSSGYLYTLRSGHVVFVPSSTHRKIMSRFRKLQRQYAKKGIQLAVVG